MNKIIIDLLRHGDVAGGKKLLGKTDEPLSELGWQQLHAITEGKKCPWQKIISSPLQRCLAYAEQLAEQHALPMQVEDRFQEIDFGLWDGELLTALYSGPESQYLSQFIQNPYLLTPPKGETYKKFELRVFVAWQQLLKSLHEQQVEHCVVVCHAGVIRTLFSLLLDFPATNLFRIEVPYANLTRITQYDDYPPTISFHSGQLT